MWLQCPVCVCVLASTSFAHTMASLTAFSSASFMASSRARASSVSRFSLAASASRTAAAAIAAAMVAAWTSMPYRHSASLLRCSPSLSCAAVACRLPVAIDGARFKFGEKILVNE